MPMAISSAAMVRSLSVALAAMLLTGCDMQSRPSAYRATGEVIAFSGGDGGQTNACFTCHGVRGEGDGRLSPRLAGLDAGYLQRQMDDYVAGRRDHAVMRAIVRKLSLDDRAKVAAYYAALPQPPIRAEPVEAPLYARGDPERGLRPCADCHGKAGQGDAGNPPLAGQPAAYLADQLLAWREGRRHNDPLGEMRLISRRLSPDEIRGLAAHAAALRGSRPRGVRATSP